MNTRVFKALPWMGLLLSLCNPAAAAVATLDSEKSIIRFISVKNAAVAEVHRFTGITGSLDSEGRASISVPLINRRATPPRRAPTMNTLTPIGS